MTTKPFTHITSSFLIIFIIYCLTRDIKVLAEVAAADIVEAANAAGKAIEAAETNLESDGILQSREKYIRIKREPVRPNDEVRDVREAPINMKIDQEAELETPAYKLTYELTYFISSDYGQTTPEDSTSADKIVSDRCGEHYAIHFLQNFITLKDWFDKKCASAISLNSSEADDGWNRIRDQSPRSPAIVHVYPFAVVQIIRNQVKIETYLNVSLRSGYVGGKSDIRACVTALNETLRSVEAINVALEESSAQVKQDSSFGGLIENASSSGMDESASSSRILEESRQSISDIRGTLGCGDARLSPNEFELHESAWVCRDNLTLDENDWGCHVKPTTSPYSTDYTRSRQTFNSSSSPVIKRPDQRRDPTTGSRVTLAPSTQSIVMSTEPPTTQAPPTVKLWNIELMKPQISRIYLAEGDRPYELTLRVWYNHSAICSDNHYCDVSMHASSLPLEFPVKPTCRTTGSSIAQWVISKPIVTPEFNINLTNQHNIKRRRVSEDELKTISHHRGSQSSSFADDTTNMELNSVESEFSYCRTTLSSHIRTESDSLLTSSSYITSTLSTPITESSINSFIVKLYIKAVLDQKYDERQTRNLTLSLKRTFRDINRDTDNDARRDSGRVNYLKNSQVSESNILENGRNSFEQSSSSEILQQIPVYVDDRDKKATCQSINDPHVTTFDGLEYNNFFQGEFILYRHKTLPFVVQTIYQRCHPTVPASCNCAVAVQSGDDVIVVDRCYRQQPDVILPSIVSRRISFNMFNDSTDSRNTTTEEMPMTPPPLSVKMYLNGKLTPGTRIFRDEVGKKYFIFLPHGALVKIMISSSLLNVWLVPSPHDLYLTEGLCGTYDWIRGNDFHLRNGSIVDEQERSEDPSLRPEPSGFIQDWRVDDEAGESIFYGVREATRHYEQVRYCECEGRMEDGDVTVTSRCSDTADVSNCDLYEGTEITESLIERALKPRPRHLVRDIGNNLTTLYQRFRRGVSDNKVDTGFDDQPIIMDKQFKSPKYSWKNAWNKALAKEHCRQYIKDNYTLGRLCAQIPSVNFKQEITTCIEDIKITGKPIWADSARDAMKEQCLEELQKNGSLPQSIVDKIRDNMCIGDCNKHGSCVKGKCDCDHGYRGTPDCSVKESAPPATYELPRYGLCDVRYKNCSSVIVYGDKFINSPNLTCHLAEVKVSDKSYTPLISGNETTESQKYVTSKRPAVFLNFNAVECPIPNLRNSYLISVSNDGLITSDPLLFIPFDSACSTCNFNNVTCVKLQNSCIIDGRCYREGEKSERDQCLVCKAIDDEFEWTTVTEPRCRPDWWDGVYLPDWVVAIAAALGGSLIGVAMGFLLYQCCCHSRKSYNLSDDTERSDRPDGRSRVRPSDRTPIQEFGSYAGPNSPPHESCDDSLLHRNPVPPDFSYNPFGDLALPQSDAPALSDDLSLLFTEGRGVETGVDCNTYF